MRPFLFLSTAMLASLLAASLGAQSLGRLDDGSLSSAVPQQGGPGSWPPGSLTTTFASNNQFAGNMFDITPAFDMRLTGMDINVAELHGTATIEIWWRSGTSVGFEDSSSGWHLIGTFSSASGGTAGTDQPTFIDLSSNGVCFQANQTYGIYVNLVSFTAGIQTLRYTDGGPNTYANADLTLVTNCGKGDPDFGGGTFFPRQWNGTIHYQDCPGALVLTKGSGGSCPGATTFVVNGVTPGATIAWLWGFPGSFAWTGSPCAGLTLDMASPTVGATSTAAVLVVTLPAGACGRVRVQAVDLAACVASNFLDL